jgi:hypothetical protein
MENKPQIGIVAPEADITLLFSELGKKSPIIFSLADILPVPFEAESYPFVLGGADGIILAACIDRAEDTEKLVKIIKTWKLVRQSDRFSTLIAIVLWGNAADEASLGIAHPNVLVCDQNTKHLPPILELTKILQTEIPNIEPVDWIDRYEFIANRFALKKANQTDDNTSETLNALQENNQNLENKLAQLQKDLETQTNEKITFLQESNQTLENEVAGLKENAAKQNDEKLKALEDTKQDLENQFLQMKTEFVAEKDAKSDVLKAKQELENQLIQLKEEFAAQKDEKAEENQILEKELTKLKKDSVVQNDERVKSLQKAIKILEKEIAQLKENLTETNGEFEQLIALKNAEIEDLRNNQEEKKKITSLQKTNQSLEEELIRIKEEFSAQKDEQVTDLENQLVQLKADLTKENDERLHYLQESNEGLQQELAQSKEEFTAKSEELESILLLKTSEVEELQKIGLEEKIIGALQEDNQNLENQLTQLKQSLEQQIALSKEEFAAKSEELEGIIVLKTSEIEELQKTGLEEKIIFSLQESNEMLEKQLAQSIEVFVSKSKEFETLISLKDIIIEDLQTNQAKENQILEEQIARLEKDFAAQNDKRITLLENDNKILDYQITQLKKDFITQTDEFEKLSSLKSTMIEDLRNRHSEENKKLTVLMSGLNNEIYELKAKNLADITLLENKVAAKTKELQKLITLQAEQNERLDESTRRIKELQAEKIDISSRENLLQKDLSDLIIHLREEFINSRTELTGKDTEIQHLREKLERQNQLTEVVLKSTKGENIAALRLEIDNEFSDDKPLYQIHSQLSLLRKECEYLLEEKERLQRNSDVPKENSFSSWHLPEIPENNKIFAEELLEL